MSLRESSAKIEGFYQHYASVRKPEQLKATEECESWILTPANTSICTLSELEALDINAFSSTPPPLLPFDHRHAYDVQPIVFSQPTFVFYANPYSKDFLKKHSYLAERATQGQLFYILRWKPASDASNKKQTLSGYGVGLDIKKADYLAIDDRNLDTTDLKSTAGEEESGLDDLRPLTRRELQSRSI